MRYICQSLIFLVVALVTVSTPVSGQVLEAKVAGARLPFPISDNSAVYDGVDNVYVFGG
jgi:hypothetical protein